MTTDDIEVIKVIENGVTVVTTNFIPLSATATASFANTASYALTSAGTITNAVSASYAASASYAPGGTGGSSDWNTLVNKPSGIVSSSIQVISDLPVGSVSSSAQVDFNSIQNKPSTIPTASYVAGGNISGKVSSATTADTASYVSAGNVAGTVASSSYSTTASAATSITFVPVLASTASYVSAKVSSATTADSASYIQGANVSGKVATSTLADSASYVQAANVSGKVTNAITADTGSYIDYSNVVNKPTLVSSSLQVDTGSFTGSFKGDGSGIINVVSSSFATTASAITFVPLTASYAISAGSTGGGLTGNGTSGKVAAWSGGALTSSILDDNGSRITTPFPITASNFEGDGGAITGLNATNITLGTLSNVRLPSQINVTGHTGSFTGSFTGDGTAVINVVTSSYSLTSSYALTNAGTVTTAATASYVQGANVSGKVSSATTADTASYVQAANVSGKVTSATTADSASYVLSTNISGNPATSSFALTAGQLEPIAQKITGSLTVSGTIDNTGYSHTSSAFKGDGSQVTGIISSSYSTTSSAATSITFVPALATTASYVAAGNVSGKVATATTADTASYVQGANVSGKVSSATTADTSSYILAANISGNPTSASYSTTASAATSITFVPVSASSAAILNGYNNYLTITPSITSQGSWTGSVVIASRFEVFSVSASSYSRIRLYNSVANRDADLTRTTASLASASIGLLLDTVCSGTYQCVYMSPPPLVYGGTGSATSTIQMTVNNFSDSSVAVSASLNYLSY